MNITHTITKYPLSTLCIVGIWVLSLLPFFPETPLDDIQFIDKWTHLVMYLGTGIVIWMEYWLRNKKLFEHNRNNFSVHRPQPAYTIFPRFKGIIKGSFVSLSLMGGLLELLQEYCTTTRNGDWIDFLADVAGAFIAYLLGSTFFHFYKVPGT